MYRYINSLCTKSYMTFQNSEYECHPSVQIMICKVNFTKILLPQESKVSTFFLKLKSGPEDGDQGHGLLQGQGLLLRHQGPKRVRPTPFLAKEIKVSTFFPSSNPASLMGIRATACYSNFKVQKDFVQHHFLQRKSM